MNDVPPLPPFATSAWPGSPQKIEVMRQRVAAGFQPHHPADLRQEAPRGLSRNGRKLAKFLGPSRALAE
jgi:hypothetical protein